MKDPWNVVRAFSCLAALLLTVASTSAPPGTERAQRVASPSGDATLVGTLVPALPWIVLPVVAFEWVVDVMMLAAGRKARAGQAAGAAWNFLLARFGPWG